jgi:hypothetical protein
MNYQKLYQKYKYKYITLKNTLYGGNDNIKVNECVGSINGKELLGCLVKKTSNKLGWVLKTDSGEIRTLKLENLDKTWRVFTEKELNSIKSTKLKKGMSVGEFYYEKEPFSKLSERLQDNSGWKLENGYTAKDSDYDNTWTVKLVDINGKNIQLNYATFYFTIKPDDSDSKYLQIWNNMTEPRSLSSDSGDENGIYVIYIDNKGTSQIIFMPYYKLSKYMSIKNEKYDT